jgi:thiamine pyrophosphokinase
LVIDTASGEDFESIQQLLEWSPTVIVTDRTVDQVLLWGIKIDVAVAINDRLTDIKNLLENQLPLKILSCNAEKEALDTALYFLTASKQKSVNVISDATLESFEKFSSLDVAVIQNGKRWVFIRNGHFEKWLPANTTLSIYPKAAHPEVTLEKDGMVTVHKDHSFWISEK